MTIDDMPDPAGTRRAWTVPPARGSAHGLDLAWLDPADPDDRQFLILAEHPEIWDALEKEADAAALRDEPSGARLHITIHEVVTNQLWDGEPSEVWDTARRLQPLGYGRHEILHMLGSVVTDHLYEALTEGRPYDRDAYIGALGALPATWEALRDV